MFKNHNIDVDINSSKIIKFASVFFTLFFAYGLLFTGLFSLRNDQLQYYLPCRIYISDAIKHHEFLLWNPFMSGSYPMHSDMQGSLWNPIVLILAWLFDYNHTTFILELFLYYLIAAFGSYKFISNFSKNTYTKITIAICYGCGGFAVSIPEFMSWAGSMAFLPWAMHFYVLLLRKKNLNASIGLGFSIWLLMVCGYPAFLIFLLYILVISSLLYFIKLYKNDLPGLIKLLKYLLVSIIFCLLISLPAIHSFLEFIPYYTRGKNASTAQIDSEYFTLTYIFSLIFPNSYFSEKHYYLEDFQGISYIGLMPLIVIFLQIKDHKHSRLLTRFILTGGFLVFLFTLASTTPFRMWCAKYLPLMNAFGFSHSMRVFIMFGCFVLAAPCLDALFNNPALIFIQKIKRIALFISVSIIIYTVIIFPHASFVINHSKSFFIADFLWQILLLAILYFIPIQFFRIPRFVLLFILIDMSVSVYLTFPLTGLSKVKPAGINKIINTFYKENTPVQAFAPTSDTQFHIVNVVKKIPHINFPSNTKFAAYVKYVSNKTNRNRLLSLPFAFANNKQIVQVQQINLGYNHINIDLLANEEGQLVLQQNYYKRWKSANPLNTISAYDSTLMQVAFKKGENHIRLYYYATDIMVEFYFSICFVLVGLICIIYPRKKEVVLYKPI